MHALLVFLAYMASSSYTCVIVVLGLCNKLEYFTWRESDDYQIQMTHPRAEDCSHPQKLSLWGPWFFIMLHPSSRSRFEHAVLLENIYCMDMAGSCHSVHLSVLQFHQKFWWNWVVGVEIQRAKPFHHAASQFYRQETTRDFHISSWGGLRGLYAITC